MTPATASNGRRVSTSKFVISLDFELFWGVSDQHTVGGYGRNVLGEWEAIPRMLAMFRQHRLRVTWATVGMIMCRDYKQWREIRPPLLPHYFSAYRMDDLVKEHARLFFARPLVDQILATPGQELGTHTYSHFCCKEPSATPAQFAADLACARMVAEELGVRFHSVVFPRNQITERFLDVLPAAGIQVFRGNSSHWLYRNGDAVAGGLAGRAVRFADACLPLSGKCVVHEERRGHLVDIPASLFLYPWSEQHCSLSTMRLWRLKQAMTAAARSGEVFHLWWHPHNFGINLEHNMAMLEEVLEHYRMLADRYGMESHCMRDFEVAHAAFPRPAGCRSLPAPVITQTSSIERSS